MSEAIVDYVKDKTYTSTSPKKFGPQMMELSQLICPIDKKLGKQSGTGGDFCFFWSCGRVFFPNPESIEGLAGEKLRCLVSIDMQGFQLWKPWIS